MQATTIRNAHSTQQENDSGYTALERYVSCTIAEHSGPLFTTDAEGLFDVYLNAIPQQHRQHYNCHCCRRFIERYGNLVFIDESGKATPLLWVAGMFGDVGESLAKIVSKARTNGVFLSSEMMWGNPQTGTWTHLSGTPKALRLFKHAINRASQVMAEKKEDYAMLSRGLADFGKEVVEQAVRVLKADAVDRSEKTLGVAEWLLNLHTGIEASGKNRKTKENLVWLAVATAPPGFCHVRTTMVSTLLDDLSGGMDFAAVKRRWAEKMHPLQYQRPTTIKTGAIEKAEKIVAALDASGALRRRFATLDEVVTFWRPKMPDPIRKKVGGVFDHLKDSKASTKTVELLSQTMTWDKFSRTVLPNAKGIELWLDGHSLYPFCPLVTAVDPEAQPILQWDTDPRNPFSWYFWHGSRRAVDFGLSAGWVKVVGLCNSPPHWYHPDKFKHHGESLHWLLDGCRDVNYKTGALFFPECLRTEFHEIRQVMERHSQQSSIERTDGAVETCGIGVHKGQPWNLDLRVAAADGTALYRLDRWE